MEDFEDEKSPRSSSKAIPSGKRKYRRHPKVRSAECSFATRWLTQLNMTQGDDFAPKKPPSAYVSFASGKSTILNPHVPTMFVVYSRLTSLIHRYPGPGETTKPLLCRDSEERW